MIRLTAAYPLTPGGRFDFEYYTTKHVELFREQMRDSGIREITIERGVSGAAPSAAAANVCVFSATFSDAKRFRAAWAKASPVILKDAPNYTNVAPKLQVGEIIYQ